MDEADGTKTVNNHCGGIGGNTEGLFPCTIHSRHRDCQPQIGLEPADCRSAINRIHGNDRNIIAVGIESLLQEGEFRLAGLAVRKPEVEDDRLLALQQFGKGIFRTVCRSNREIKHHAAQMERSAVHIHVGKQLGLQNDLGGLSGNSVTFLQIIAGGHSLENHHIAISRRGCKGHFTLRIGLRHSKQVI